MSSSGFPIEVLGAACPDPEGLRTLVADQVGRPVTTLSDVRVFPVDYDVVAITTAARWWVRGTATTPSGDTPFAFFVKVVQAWSRSPVFDQVPEELREVAAAGFPYRIEAAVYRSELASRLPDGLRMAPCYAVIDLDAESYSLWLGVVPVLEAPWAPARYERAAHLLGRLSGSARVAELAGVGAFGFAPHDYVRGRLSMQVVPILQSDLWQHPLLRDAFDDELHRRVDTVLGRLDALSDELDAIPRTTTHGDAAPGNLLVTSENGFTLIDFGFWTPMPVGFDLGQLLVGDVVLGKRSADSLATIDQGIVAAYLAGLRAEAAPAELADERTLRRGHALELLLFRGLSAMPFDLLDASPDVLAYVARQRAMVTRYSLDLLDSTE